MYSGPVSIRTFTKMLKKAADAISHKFALTTDRSSFLPLRFVLAAITYTPFTPNTGTQSKIKSRAMGDFLQVLFLFVSLLLSRFRRRADQGWLRCSLFLEGFWTLRSRCILLHQSPKHSRFITFYL